MAADGFRLAEELRALFLRASAREALASSDVLDELVSATTKCLSGFPDPHRTVAYVLRSFFRAASDSFSERCVPLEEAQKFQQSCHGPIREAIELLESPEATQNEAISRCARLIDAQVETLPMV